MRPHPRISALFICLCLSIAADSHAATLNVNNLPGKNCSDSGSGTALRPYCSLQLAVSRARPGDIVTVSGGAYGPAQLDVTTSGTALAPIIIRAVPRRSAVIVGPAGAGESAGAGVKITASYVVFEGFEVRDSAGTGIRNGGSYVTIRDNYVHDNARRCAATVKCGQGIASNNTAPRAGVVIERNLSVSNGTSASQDHDFYISNPGAVIRNNIAVNSSGFGFQIYPNCDSCLIYNNVAWGTRNAGFLIGGDGAANFSSGVIVANNIALSNGGSGFYIYRNGVEVVSMHNNIAYGNSGGALRMNSSPAPVNTDFLQVDPRLKSPAGSDFHLQPGSPAIDRGDSSLTPPDDIDGDARIIGLQVDIGVDEAVLAAPPPEVADLRFLDRSTVAWTGSPVAAGYAVFRGGLAARAWVYDHSCLAAGVAVTTVVDAQSPSPGSGFYYLVAGSNAAGVGTLGISSSGAQRLIPPGCQ